jgi:hypothetical protein
MGLVLVFDLDQTIIDSSHPIFFDPSVTPEEMEKKVTQSLNDTVITILKRAAKLRPDKVSILLLTNNSVTRFISAVDTVIGEIIKGDNPENPERAVGKYKTSANTDPDTDEMPVKPYFFDSIMIRQHKERKPSAVQGSPLKGIDDVEKLLSYIGIKISSEELLASTYFFDDMIHEGMLPLGEKYTHAD